MPVPSLVKEEGTRFSSIRGLYIDLSWVLGNKSVVGTNAFQFWSLSAWSFPVLFETYDPWNFTVLVRQEVRGMQPYYGTQSPMPDPFETYITVEFPVRKHVPTSACIDPFEPDTLLVSLQSKQQLLFSNITYLSRYHTYHIPVYSLFSIPWG